MVPQAAQTVLAEGNWPDHLGFLVPLFDANKQPEVAAALRDKNTDRLLELIDLRQVSVEAIAWVKAESNADFVVEGGRRHELFVFFRPTGKKIPPHLHMLEEHSRSSDFQQACLLGQFLISRNFVSREELHVTDGYTSLVGKFSNGKKNKFDMLWRKFLVAQEKKKSELKRIASSPKKEEEHPAGEVKLDKDAPVQAVHTVFLRVKESSTSGSDIRSILAEKELGSLLAGDGKRYKVKTSSLDKLKAEFSELADVEEEDEASAVVAKNFAMTRAQEEADAEKHCLRPRETLEAIRIIASNRDPILRSLGGSLSFSNERLQKVMARGDTHREEKKRKRQEVLDEVKEEDGGDEFMASPVA